MKESALAERQGRGAWRDVAGGAYLKELGYGG